MSPRKPTGRPRGRPRIGDTPTVNITVRIPSDIAAIVKQAAMKESITITAWLRRAIEYATVAERRDE